MARRGRKSHRGRGSWEAYHERRRRNGNQEVEGIEERHKYIKTRNGDYRKEDHAKVISIVQDPKDFFTGVFSVHQHYKEQTEDCGRYCATFVTLVKNRIKITKNSKIRALAIALGRKDINLVTALLKTRSQFGLVEVLKAITLLDAGRQARVLERRLKRLELSTNKADPKKFSRLRIRIKNLHKLKLPIRCASGAVCKHIKRWVQTLSQEELEFYAIRFRKKPWQKLADICHFNPKDFPSAPWFLPHCFGDDSCLPDGSLVKACLTLSKTTVNEVVNNFTVPLCVVKKFTSSLNEESKLKIAMYEPLDSVLWNYGILWCEKLKKALYDRLSCVDANTVSMSNGKLLERILSITDFLYKKEEKTLEIMNRDDHFLSCLIKIAETKLTSIRISLDSPIVVLGDASEYMSITIRTSSIIACLLMSMCSVKLVFFSDVSRDPPFPPKTVREMVKLALMTKGSGSTIPAASLYPFYEKKEIVKTFIVVTDEKETGTYNGYRFAPLFKKYHEEVYPATLVFVSFLEYLNETGQMVKELQSLGIFPMELELDNRRANLSKLDDLVGRLSTLTNSFQDQISAAEKKYKENGVAALFEGI